MPLETINDKLAIASMSGSLFFMLKNKNISWWEKLIYFVTGSVAAYFTGEGVVSYLHWEAGTGGILSFIAGIVVLPVMEKFLEFVKDPQKAVDLYNQVKGDKKDG